MNITIEEPSVETPPVQQVIERAEPIESAEKTEIPPTPAEPNFKKKKLNQYTVEELGKLMRHLLDNGQIQSKRFEHVLEARSQKTQFTFLKL